MEYTGYGSRGYDMDAVASVSQFNQSFVGEPESGAYDNYFSSNNDHAYKNAMYEHDEGHLLLNNADTTNQHANSTKDDASAFLRGAIKKGGKLVGDETEQVTESFAQHKYSRLANSSYDYFNSRGKITGHRHRLASWLTLGSEFLLDWILAFDAKRQLEMAKTGKSCQKSTFEGKQL